jgi:catechol 2,3-dioxygenase-like lactoylglutathione lyase family enzyme
MAIKLAVPVLRVTDVARSIEWYRGTFGFGETRFPPADAPMD